MPKDFTRSNPALEREIAQITDPSVLQNYLATLLPAPQPAPNAVATTSQPQDRPSAERIIYPFGNIRIALTGLSEQELDQAEARIRAALCGH